MTVDTPVIIEAAINGGSSKRRNPNVPREPSEIIEDTYRCLDAGAAIIHAHNSDYQLTGQVAADDYLAAWRVILEERPGTLWYPTLSGGSDVHEVLAPIASGAGKLHFALNNDEHRVAWGALEEDDLAAPNLAPLHHRDER